MKLAAWHHQRGDHIELTRRIPERKDMFLSPPTKIYGSTIFEFSKERTAKLREVWPEAIIGGTGLGPSGASVILDDDIERIKPDYSLYPKFTGSLGFTQRGCRLSCKFCVVPIKEGKNRTVNTIADIWRGDGHPRHLHLLDNDFFGQPAEQWRERIKEIQEGGFKVCFNQGINIRLINEEAAAAIASIDYRDDSFSNKRIYTAWDNLKLLEAHKQLGAFMEKAGIRK